MKSGLFNKNNHEPHCGYCEHGKFFEGDDVILCKRNGIMKPEDVCKHFKYDPLKRPPAKIKLNNDFTKEDFEL